jgi:hypothetical protein
MVQSATKNDWHTDEETEGNQEALPQGTDKEHHSRKNELIEIPRDSEAD